MTQQTPDWIDKKFLTLCIQGGEETTRKILVTNFSTSAAVPPGNNYGSYIFRVKVEYKDNNSEDDTYSLSLIVKAPLTEGPVKEIFDENNIANEPIFYNTFLPEAAKITEHFIAPKSYFCPIPDVVVLEDLNEQGYIMVDRSKLLDFQHCRLYVIAAATFHATSFAVHKVIPDVIDSLGVEKLLSHKLKSTKMMKTIIRDSVKCLAENMGNLERYKKYTQITYDAADKLWNMLVEAHQPTGEFNCLHQGDPWCTNMMFKYDAAGSVCQVKLLDFQAMRYGSPVNDLVFFIWSSANYDVRKDRLEELYHLYQNTLNNKLQELNCTEKLTYENFTEDIKRLKPLALWLAAGQAAMRDTEPLDLELISSKENGDETKENMYKKYYTESYCNNHLPELLETLESAGVFQYLSNNQ